MLFAFPLRGISSAGELEKFVREVAIRVGHGGGERGERNEARVAGTLPWECSRIVRLLYRK